MESGAVTLKGTTLRIQPHAQLASEGPSSACSRGAPAVPSSAASSAVCSVACWVAAPAGVDAPPAGRPHHAAPWPTGSAGNVLAKAPNRSRPAAPHLVRGRNGQWYVRLLVPKRVLQLYPQLRKEWRKCTQTTSHRRAKEVARDTLMAFYQVLSLSSQMSEGKRLDDLLRSVMGNPGQPSRPGASHTAPGFHIEYDEHQRLRSARTDPWDTPEERQLVRQALEREQTLKQLGAAQPGSAGLDPNAAAPALHRTAVSDRPLAAAIEHYLQDCRAKGTHNARTITHTLGPRLRHFRELLSEDPDVGVAAITPEAIDAFVSDLRRFPERQGKRAGESARAALAAGGKPISRENAVNRMRSTLGLIEWLVLRNELPPIVSGRLSASLVGSSLRKAKSAKDAQPLGIEGDGHDGYVAFTATELARIFDPSVYVAHSAGDAARYWIPLIGRYTGCRINEIAGALVDDVRQIQGIECLCVTDLEPGQTDSADGRKRVKTAASRRTVPLHPQLMALGFLDYVAQRRAQRQERLFDLKYMDKDGYGKYPGRDFQNLTKAVGVWQRRRKVFHSFRATVSQELEAQGLDAQLVDRFLGHSVKTVRAQHYGRNEYGATVPLVRVAQALARLPGLPNLPPWTEVSKAKRRSLAKLCTVA